MKLFMQKDSSITFKISIFNLVDKHHNLMKSLLTLSVLKNYFENIKQICVENSNEFQ